MLGNAIRQVRGLNHYYVTQTGNRQSESSSMKLTPNHAKWCVSFKLAILIRKRVANSV